MDPSYSGEFTYKEGLSKIVPILLSALQDYVDKKGTLSNGEWLKGYLQNNVQEMLPPEVLEITETISETLYSLQEKGAELRKAVEEGQSFDNWFVRVAMSENEGNGAIAKKAAQLLTELNSQDANSANEEAPEDTEEEWDDQEWNSYRLKELLKQVASSAGNSVLLAVASDVSAKWCNEGFDAVKADGQIIKEMTLIAASEDLKYVLSAGLQVARIVYPGIVPEFSNEEIAYVAHNAVERFRIFSRMIRGELTMTEGMIAINEVEIATLACLWEKHKDFWMNGIIKNLFGLKGQCICSMADGMLLHLMNPDEEKSVMSVIGVLGRSVLSVLGMPNTNQNVIETMAENLNMEGV